MKKSYFHCFDLCHQSPFIKKLQTSTVVSFLWPRPCQKCLVFDLESLDACRSARLFLASRALLSALGRPRFFLGTSTLVLADRITQGSNSTVGIPPERMREKQAGCLRIFFIFPILLSSVTGEQKKNSEHSVVSMGCTAAWVSPPFTFFR